MATIYHEEDTDVSALGGRRIAVLGYGSQGRARPEPEGLGTRRARRPARRLVEEPRRPRRPASGGGHRGRGRGGRRRWCCSPTPHEVYADEIAPT